MQLSQTPCHIFHKSLKCNIKLQAILWQYGKTIRSKWRPEKIFAIQMIAVEDDGPTQDDKR